MKIFFQRWLAELKEWRELRTRQKLILGAFFIFTIPMLPLNIIFIPFAHWITSSANMPYRPITLLDFIGMSFAMSIMAYLMLGLAFCGR